MTTEPAPSVLTAATAKDVIFAFVTRISPGVVSFELGFSPYCCEIPVIVFAEIVPVAPLVVSVIVPEVGNVTFRLLGLACNRTI